VLGKLDMTGFEDTKRLIRRNKLLGLWAAEKLGIAGADAEAYSNALAVGTIDPERSDAFSKIREDFNLAGVIQSDDQILTAMNDIMLQVANQIQTRGGDATDAAAMMLARKLTSQ
jgi:hypothetical protein